MSKRKKKPGKQFKLKLLTPGSRAINKRSHGRRRRGVLEGTETIVIPYKSFFFEND